MNGQIGRLAILVSGAGILLVLASAFPLQSAHAFELVTQEEAKLPPDTTYTRGISRGPRVTLVWPAPDAGSLKSPLRLKISFQGRGDDQVDPDSVLVTYARIPPVDLTERIRPFIRSDGIEIDDAVVPPGHHRLQLKVKDTSGRIGVLDFTFDVTE
jgi:hypothetical protein